MDFQGQSIDDRRAHVFSRTQCLPKGLRCPSVCLHVSVCLVVSMIVCLFPARICCCSLAPALALGSDASAAILMDDLPCSLSCSLLSLFLSPPLLFFLLFFLSFLPSFFLSFSATLDAKRLPRSLSLSLCLCLSYLLHASAYTS